MNTNIKTVMLALSMTAATTCFAEEGSSQPESLPIYPTPDMKVEYHTEWTKGHYPVKIREFMASPLVANDIVFIGDSITEKGGDWGKAVWVWSNTQPRNCWRCYCRRFDASR